METIKSARSDVEKQIDACGKKEMIVHIESISPG